MLTAFEMSNGFYIMSDRPNGRKLIFCEDFDPGRVNQKSIARATKLATTATNSAGSRGLGR